MNKVLLGVLAFLVVAGMWLLAAASGWLGSPEAPGEIHAEARPAAATKERAAVQAETARLLGETDETFFASLERTLAMAPESLTIYQLEVPLNTPLYRAWREDWERHRRLARWTWPIWFYVSVTGVLVYFCLYHLNPSEVG